MTAGECEKKNMASRRSSFVESWPRNSQVEGACKECVCVCVCAWVRLCLCARKVVTDCLSGVCLHQLGLFSVLEGLFLKVPQNPNFPHGAASLSL